MRLKLPSVLSSCAGLAAAALLSVSAGHASAQTSAQVAAGALLATPSAQISAPVENSVLVTLKGNTHPLAQARFDQGAAPASLATGKMQLLFKRTAAQKAALTQYMGSLQDPHSASYRKWLTPAAYGASFGIADQDLQVVEQWLTSEGFKVEPVPASRNLIQFSGTAGQVAQAFHTTIHSYLINGERHYSNASDPQIPAALAAVVAGVSPLNNFEARPQHVLSGHAQAQVTTEGASPRLQLLSALSKGASASHATASTATALLTTTQSNPSAPFLLVTPSDMATIYNTPNPLNRNFTSGTQQNGAGVSIGLIEDSNLPLADYANYRKTFLQEASPVQPTVVIDGVDPGVLTDGNGDEALLDAEFAAGLAPQASLYVYVSSDDALESGVYDAALRAVEDNQVAIMSVSFGNCEADLGAAGNQEISELWQQAAAQGITVLVAAGDSGSASCDATGGTSAVDGLTVSGFASTPYDIAVGGTDFDALVTNFSQYVAAAANQSVYYGTALGYIPENPWNDSISNEPPGAYTTNTAEQYPDAATGTTFTVLEGGGGGASTAAVCSGALDANGNCIGVVSGYPTPSFQTGIAVSGSVPAGVRYLPDVSLFAAPGNLHQAAWAFCSDNVTDGEATARVDCSPDSTGEFNISGVGGTSASTPAFAGMLSMVLQSLSGTNVQRLGLANNTLYNLFATSSNSASIFHDVTIGNNSVPCAAGSLNCGTNGFLLGYNAGAGYDLANGLGSVDVTQLIAAWDLVQFTQSTVTLAANNGTSAVSIVHGTAVTLSTTVNPTTAAGTVAVLGTPANTAGGSVNEDIPLTNGTGSISVTDLPGGSYNLQAYYQGDVKNSPSTSSQPIPIVVTPEASAPFLSLAIYDLATGNSITANPVPYGAYGYAYINPANSNAGTVGSHGIATGSATLLNNGATLASQNLNSQGVAAFPLYSFAPGTYTLGATYAGDSSYNASSTTATQTLQVVQAPTQLTVHTGTATSAAGAVVTVELDTDSAGASPTGAVTLAINGTNFTGVATPIVLSDGADGQLITFTLPAGAITSGTNKLLATYPGDTNYISFSTVACTYTPAAAAALTPSELPRSGGLSPRVLLAGGSSMVLVSALFFAIPARRRAWRSLLVVFFAVGLVGAIGCGGTSTSTTGTTITTQPACAK